MNAMHETGRSVESPGELHGYRLLQQIELSDLNIEFYNLVHERSGARHIHIASADRENTFGVAFKTVPTDSTGVAHILEHTVLCGSRKYPVKDPFFSMLKRSLSSFMNAFTASDWTMYPFSTPNQKDFYNLLDVYLDAVFSPNIDRISFKQEGHRLEVVEGPADGNRGKLQYKGVVYNEMKGAMSSPDQVMARSLLNALYPDTTYRFNSGGDPAVIPSLSHDQLVAFHRRHYHPSNAYFYTYGHLPLADHLAFINDVVLKRFERIDPETDVASQPRWSAPKTAVYHYALSPGEDPSKKSQACLAWLTADIKRAFDMLSLKLLAEILLGNAASPLRKALIDSNLGSALADVTGYDAENRDTLFACGLKDVHAEDAAEIESLVLDVLGRLAADGIDRELVDSAIHQLEFKRKEVTNTPFPFGIKLLLSIAGSWFHGGDVLRVLCFDDDLQRIRDAVRKGPFFETVLKEQLIDNPHRVRFTLKPDPDLLQREDQRTARRLREIYQNMSSETLASIVKDAAALKALQEGTEDVSVLPTLTLGDVSPAIQKVSPSDAYPALPAVCYRQPTAGIVYVTAALEMVSLTPEQLPLAPFFCYALTRIGTRKRGFAEVVRRIDRYTGGVGLRVQARTRLDAAGTCLPMVTLDGKALTRNQHRLMDIIAEILFSADFTDRGRLTHLLWEYRAGLESMVIQNGHRLAISLSARTFSKAAALSEMWSGIHQLKTLKQMTAALDQDSLEKLASSLADIRQAVAGGNRLGLAVIGEADALDELAHESKKKSALLQAAVPGVEDLRFGLPETGCDDRPAAEGWATSTAVSFVALTLPAVRMNHADAPVLAVISKLLRSLFLHREIREKGGAYGGFALYQMESGLFSFASYRDPHIVATLNAFERACEFIRSGAYTDEDVKEAILQVCSEIDKPHPPGPLAIKAFHRRIVGMSDDDRQGFKDRLLEVERKAVRRVAQDTFRSDALPQGIAVISSESLLNRANQKGLTPPLAIQPI